MKKKLKLNIVYSAVSVPQELKKEFRKVCILQDLKPHDIIRELVTNWVKKEKKKETYPLSMNG